MLSFEEYKSKVAGCFLGKNIGGTFGGPFENPARCPEEYRGKQRFFGVEFYTHDLSAGPLPNDDLDLQLVWLCAAERYQTQLTSRILGEYWLAYITPSWSEYGGGKANLRLGLEPPLSGSLNNIHACSNGAWIRSEIWACLAPGNPKIAAHYAKMDAQVDHTTEGIYGEVFCAALQSAAFVESDSKTLLDIACSYIPQDCGVAGAIKCVVDSYEKGLSWQEALDQLLKAFPSSFCIGCYKRSDTLDYESGPNGYDAPANIGITVLAWLFGKGDFATMQRIAVNCGEDTDCTAATVGALYGILHGASGIPKEWADPIGTQIHTACINISDGTINIPATVDELTERILALTPKMLPGCQLFDGPGYSLPVQEELYAKQAELNYWTVDDIMPEPEISPYQVRYDFPRLSAVLDYLGEPLFFSEGIRKMKLRLRSVCGVQSWANIRLLGADDVRLEGGECMCYVYQYSQGMSEVKLQIRIGEIPKARLDFALEIRLDSGFCYLIPVTLLKEKGQRVSGYGETYPENPVTEWEDPS